MEAVIKVKNLVKQYKNTKSRAVDDISFEVFPGELFAFLGPNGAGKTTTISILTTTLSKTSGSVMINGFEIENSASQIRQSIGVIFQKPSLDINLTAEENIRFHCILYGIVPFMPTYSMMPQSYKDKVNELSQLLGIKEDIFKPIKTFSGGMTRKLEIIRSLMHDPKILFLDEPTEGLDPLSRKTFWEYLNKTRKERNVTIFLTTHYLNEAEGADRVCIVKGGKIASLTTPAELKNILVNEYASLNSPDKPALIKELNALGVAFEDQGNLVVKLPSDQVPDLLRKLNTKISFLDVHNPTLEEAYIEVIERGDATKAAQL